MAFSQVPPASTRAEHLPQSCDMRATNSPYNCKSFMEPIIRARIQVLKTLSFPRCYKNSNQMLSKFQCKRVQAKMAQHSIWFILLLILKSVTNHISILLTVIWLRQYTDHSLRWYRDTNFYSKRSERLRRKTEVSLFGEKDAKTEGSKGVRKIHWLAFIGRKKAVIKKEPQLEGRHISSF